MNAESAERSLSMYFDNIQLTHERGPLVEENCYYPFGLTAAGLSSRALNFGGAENKKKYNGYEENKDFDLNWYESFYRTHDPQTGRFWQVDPKAKDFESSYAAMGNNPITNIDLLGDIYEGLTTEDAKKAKKDISETFGSKKFDAFNALIRIGENGRTFDKISEEDFKKATNKFDPKELALAKAYKELINSEKITKIAYRKEEDLVGSFFAGLFAQTNETYVKPGTTEKVPVDENTSFRLATPGGGITLYDNNTANTAYILLIENSLQMRNDLVDVKTNKYINWSDKVNDIMTVTSSSTMNHEIGHVLGRNNASNTRHFTDAIQTENLGEHVRGQRQYYRNGRDHELPQVELMKHVACGIPSFLR